MPIRKFYYDNKTRGTDIMLAKVFVDSLTHKDENLRRRVVDACRKKGILKEVFEGFAKD